MMMIIMVMMAAYQLWKKGAVETAFFHRIIMLHHNIPLFI